MSPTCLCCGKEVIGKNNKPTLKKHLKEKHNCATCNSRGEHCPYRELAFEIMREVSY